VARNATLTGKSRHGTVSEKIPEKFREMTAKIFSKVGAEQITGP
jgi:hypothetical protein